MWIKGISCIFGCVAIIAVFVTDIAADCSGLPNQVSKCKAYFCTSAGQLGLNKYVLGEFVEGCKYIEYSPQLLIECSLPMKNLRTIAQKFFLNQENIPILEVMDKKEQDLYCRTINMVEQEYVSEFTQALSALYASIEQGHFNSLFLTKEQVRILNGNKSS